jgi:precorrin-2 methylase
VLKTIGAETTEVSLQPDLFLIGLGVMIPGHITVQATQAISRCDLLYSILQEAPRLWIPADRLGQTEVVNALEWYAEGNLRSQNYEQVARKILKAVGRGRSVGYVTYGNPMAYDRVAQNLVNYAKEAGFGVQVVPGISSLDTVFCDLQVDMAPGIQVFEASWLVACEIKPRVDVPVLLLQVGAFGSLRTHYTKRQDGSSLTELVEYLCKIYPKSHVVSLVRSTGDENQATSVRHVGLGSLCEVTADQLSGASLYIPPSEKALPKQEILARMSEV